MAALGFAAITVNGLAAYALGQPLLFLSLLPTVFTVFRQPLSKIRARATSSSGTSWPSP